MRTLLLATAALLAACTATPLPRHAVYHAADADLSITRIVHGALVVEMHGTRLLVDPWFDPGLFGRQTEALGLTPDALPTFDAVLVTHRHSDHFDRSALAKLAASVPTAIGPPDVKDRLAALGFKSVVALGWWDATRVGAIDVTAVPARHAVPENGYVVASGGVTAYLAGDTRPFPQLVDVATAFPSLDAALLPIGGARLLGFAREMTPGDAARAAGLLGARRIIPIGYGESSGFPFRWHPSKPVDRFVAACHDRGIERDRIIVLEPGESWHYYR